MTPATRLGGILACPRCGRDVVQRGDKPARYCANCGLRLATGLPAPNHGLTYATTSVLAALASFMPLCGIFLSIVAIAFGVAALHENRLQRDPSINKIAWTGTILGAGTALAWLFLCRGGYR